jgi:hypothetical protein
METWETEDMLYEVVYGYSEGRGWQMHAQRRINHRSPSLYRREEEGTHERR